MVKQQRKGKRIKTMGIEPAKKIENSSRSDMISDLPDHIIDNILICLPIQEAVRTSILSKKWRFKWRYLPKLVFDNSSYETAIIPSTAQPSIAKFFLNIYKVLFLHHGPLLNFTFHVPLLKRYPEIDQLMLYLSEKDVQEIFFKIGERKTRRVIDERKAHRMSSFLFSCVALRHLTLSSCSFPIPLAFQGFVNLISLKLQSVDFDADVFETFISKCPLLETLSIRDCFDIVNLDFDCPNLKFFHFSGSCKAICFRKTSQHLSTVIFDESFVGYEKVEPTEIFESLPVVEHLRFGFDFLVYLRYGGMPKKLSLGCLRVLDLPDLSFGWTDIISVVLCLIVSSPNLEKLELGAESADDDNSSLAKELLEVQDFLDNALKKLRVVKMNFAHTVPIKSELQFIKFLLRESVVLEKIFIQPANRTAAEGALKIVKKIRRFQRSSKKAKIVYLDTDADGSEG
ncbi:F-box/FBD/LRR-repeat protein At1g13570-like [Mercurialis annua]|uniref:F-box/FBD/LRR-repeat protein At1g13570-like n=1 Tax=Mercurialis annua TaxID=3986 RepID=UPI0021609998|nr:F-box/FBD/LRR-repeat protein At1g13570-like [Mercurialis annua]